MNFKPLLLYFTLQMENDNDVSKYLFMFQSLTTINKHIHVFPDIICYTK
jgi:hypothetical protein